MKRLLATLTALIAAAGVGLTQPAAAQETITVFAAFAGIPLGLFGIWVWRRSARNTAVVEAAFTEFLASRPA